MRIAVSSGVSENIESFSKFRHCRRICLHQKKSSHTWKEGVQNTREMFHAIRMPLVVFISLDGKVVVVRSMNKTNLADFCLTGFLQPRAHLSGDLSRLTFLQPNHFPLVSFQSHFFPLSLLLSSLIPPQFLLLSENHFYLTVSFHSSASGLNCPPLLCHSTLAPEPG